MQRLTRQRIAIRDAIEQAHRPLSAEEVLLAARAQVPAISLATVYRTLKALVAAREVNSIALPGETPRYEVPAPVSHRHHHHFQCTECARVFRVEGCPGGLDALVPDGFRLTGHAITLYGECEACAARPRTGSARAKPRRAGGAHIHSGT